MSAALQSTTLAPAHAGATGASPARLEGSPVAGPAVAISAAGDWRRIPLTLTRVGAVAHGAACVRRLTQRTTRGDKPYLDVEVAHREGATTLRVWSDQMPAWAGVRDGTAVHLGLECRAGWRPGTLEWTVTTVRRLPDDHPVRRDLLPACPVPAADLYARWDALVARLSPEAEVLLHVVLDHIGEQRYRGAPAAERMHHAVAPLGLMWHSLDVAEGALALAAVVPNIEPPLCTDAIILGGLLHDVGKVAEYEVVPGVGIRRSLTGWARYHTALGAEFIGVACALHAHHLREARVPRQMIEHLKHIAESHHGDNRDHGSPTPPRSREAWLVHAADLASARVRQLTDDALAADAPDTDGWHVARDGRRAPVLCALPSRTPPPAPGPTVVASPADAGHDSNAAPPPRPDALDGLAALSRGEGVALVLVGDEPRERRGDRSA